MQNRYSPYLNCQYRDPDTQETVAEVIEAAFLAFASFQVSVTNLYNELNQAFKTITTDFQSAGGNAASLRLRTMQYLYNYQQSLGDALSVLSNLNCGFLTDDYNSGNTAVCKNVLPSLFIVMLLTSILSLCCLFALVCVLPMANRLKAIEAAKVIDQGYSSIDREMANRT